MSSSSSASAPSSSSSSDDANGNGNGTAAGGAGGRGGRGARPRGRGADFEGPSSSRRRSGDGVWPEPFLEALAYRVAIDASLSHGRLAAAAAICNLFQVCSTWRAVSRSELLWQNLTRRIWNRGRLLHDTWWDEYVFRHRTARNFRTGHYLYTTLHFVPPDGDNNQEGLICSRLALSDHHLAAGFYDGSVRLFHLPHRLHLSTFLPHPRDDRLGRFSSAVRGIILSDTQLVFASLDGDIHVAPIDNAAALRRTQLGDVLTDGVLVDFSGCNRWWVGVYAGVPQRSFHIWDSETEQLVFVGGSLTDPNAVAGWGLLHELTEFVGRVRVTSHESAVACTNVQVIAFDLRNQGFVLWEEAFPRELIVGAFDATDDACVIVDNRGAASVLRVSTQQQVCRFAARGAPQRGVLGCMNSGYALMCVGGVVRVWEVERSGESLYSLGERLGPTTAMVADDRHVAACTSDTTIHLWDFGPQ